MNKAPEVSRFTVTRTAMRKARLHGFNTADIQEAFYAPKKMYPSKTRPGQWRRVTRSVCLVGVIDGGTFRVITVFPNGSQAPQREVAA